MTVLVVPSDPVDGLFVCSFVRELIANKEFDATLLCLIVDAPHLDFVADDVDTPCLKFAEVIHRIEHLVVA